LQEELDGFIGLARHPGDDPDTILRKNLRRIPIDPPANEGLYAKFLHFLQPLESIPVPEGKLLAPHYLAILKVEEKKARGVIKSGGNPGAEYGDGHFHRFLDGLRRAKGVPRGFSLHARPKSLVISIHSARKSKNPEYRVRKGKISILKIIFESHFINEMQVSIKALTTLRGGFILNTEIHRKRFFYGIYESNPAFQEVGKKREGDSSVGDSAEHCRRCIHDRPGLEDHFLQPGGGKDHRRFPAKSLGAEMLRCFPR
jgi:hypothetical protein